MQKYQKTMNLRKKKLKILTFYKKNWPVPYIVFAFQIPSKILYAQPEKAVVLCQPPHIGEYLVSDIKGNPLPYVDFLPLGKTTQGTHCYTQMIRVRMDIGHLEYHNAEDDTSLIEETDYSDQNIIMDWNPEAQPVVLMERGIVFGIVNVNLDKEYLEVESDTEHPIILKGAFEST